MEIENVVAAVAGHIDPRTTLSGLLGPVHAPEKVLEIMQDTDNDPEAADMFMPDYKGVLSSRRLAEITIDVLFNEDEAKPDGSDVVDELLDIKVEVEGIQPTLFGFHKGRLEAYRDEIKSMILELDPRFYRPEKEDEDWGLSFSVLRFDKNGVRWAGFAFAEELYILAAALGLAKVLLPRPMWGSVPGNMPYVAFANPETGTMPMDLLTKMEAMLRENL